MWYPQSTFAWVVVIYLLIGLLYAAYEYHVGTTPEQQEMLRKEAGPIFEALSPNVMRVILTICDVLATIFFTALWPPLLLWKIGRFVYYGVIDAWCYLFHDHSDEDEEVHT